MNRLLDPDFQERCEDVITVIAFLALMWILL